MPCPICPKCNQTVVPVRIRGVLRFDLHMIEQGEKMWLTCTGSGEVVA